MKPEENKNAKMRTPLDRDPSPSQVGRPPPPWTE